MQIKDEELSFQKNLKSLPIKITISGHFLLPGARGWDGMFRPFEWKRKSLANAWDEARLIVMSDITSGRIKDASTVKQQFVIQLNIQLILKTSVVPRL